jgi:transcriptional regulator GlxA family with amidase domain
MKAAFVIFDGMTALDFIGAYDPLTRLASMRILPDFVWEIHARTPVVTDDRGLRFTAQAIGAPLGGVDVLVVPGGFATRALRHDATFLQWLRTAEGVPLIVSVCTGALLLGAAGFLRGHRATTHPAALAELAPYCACVVRERVVDDGSVITSGGVTAAIDVSLHVVERLAGSAARQRIAQQIDYPG